MFGYTVFSSINQAGSTGKGMIINLGVLLTGPVRCGGPPHLYHRFQLVSFAMLLRFDIPLNNPDAVGDLTTSALLRFGHRGFSSLSPIKMILLNKWPQCRQVYSTDGIIIPDSPDVHF